MVDQCAHDDLRRMSRDPGNPAAFQAITAREARRARWSRLAPWWWGIMGTPTTGGPHGQ